MKHPKEVIQRWISTIQKDGRGLTPWENTFIADVARQAAGHGKFSDRQVELIERIYSDKTPNGGLPTKGAA